MKLTDAFLRSIKAIGKAQKHSDGGGLYLYVSPPGGKLWRMDYRFEGKRKTLSMGEYPAVSLADARTRRQEAKRNFHKVLPLRQEKGRQSRCQGGIHEQL